MALSRWRKDIRNCEKVRFEKESGGSQRTSVTSIDTGAEPIDTTEGYGKMTSKGNNYFP